MASSFQCQPEGLPASLELVMWSDTMEWENTHVQCHWYWLPTVNVLALAMKLQMLHYYIHVQGRCTVDAPSQRMCTTWSPYKDDYSFVTWPLGLVATVLHKKVKLPLPSVQYNWGLLKVRFRFLAGLLKIHSRFTQSSLKVCYTFTLGLTTIRSRLATHLR